MPKREHPCLQLQLAIVLKVPNDFSCVGLLPQEIKRLLLLFLFNRNSYGLLGVLESLAFGLVVVEDFKALFKLDENVQLLGLFKLLLVVLGLDEYLPPLSVGS